MALLLTSFSAQAVNVTFTVDEGYDNPAMIQKLQANLAALLNEINAAYKENRDLNLGGLPLRVPTQVGESDPRDELATLWDMTHFQCDDEEVVDRLWTMKDGSFYARQIPMVLDPDGEVYKEGTFQEVAVSFDKAGNISEFRFGMDAGARESLENCGVAEVERRNIILQFVEKFRTAYCRKDINFLNQIFSDDAIIITGSVVRTKPDDMGRSMSKTIYKRQNKQQYLANLRRAFARNKVIEVKFEVIPGECGVTQSQNNPDFYGVRLRQEWHSSTYSDEGYVFLLWDFRDETAPQIKVRTWQSEYVGTGRTEKDKVRKDELIGMDDVENMIQ